MNVEHSDVTALNPMTWLCYVYQELVDMNDDSSVHLSFYLHFLSSGENSIRETARIFAVKRFIQSVIEAVDDVEQFLIDTFPSNSKAFLTVLVRVRTSLCLIALDRPWSKQKSGLVNMDVLDTLRIIEATLSDRMEFEQFSPSELHRKAIGLREAILNTDSIDPRLKNYLVEILDELIATISEVSRTGYSNLRDRVFQFRGKLISYCSEDAVKKMDPQIYTLIIAFVGLATASVNYGTKSMGPSEKALPPVNYNVNVLEDNRFMPQIQVNQGNDDQPHSESNE